MKKLSDGEMKDDDWPLVQLVKHWKGKQLAPYLVSQLRRLEADPPPTVESIINVIAELLNDEAITNLADAYGEDVSYAGLQQEEDEKKADTLEAVDEPETVEDEDADTEKIDAATVKQKRSAMLKKFLAAVEKQMAQ